ncbi:MAG: ATP-binding cassette domain-containing protein [Syntrophorhabdaceae bacterium]|nr:ATP-binding cassette domain-containing protein [Syntrophorhabdaceae bacterium]
MGEVLSVSGLKKTYELKKTIFSYRKDKIIAVDGVSFVLHKGKTIGIVGESGSGKSTLARCILFLERPDGGEIRFTGQVIDYGERELLRSIRKKIQIIFQDPYSSLNPRKKVFEIISEPLLFHKTVEKGAVKDRVFEILKTVGLGGEFIDKYPHEMSGGQRQRVAIGRALSTDPTLLVADEPVSSLDVSIQAQIINLFLDIKENMGKSMVFISHDLSVVRFVSDEIIVMYRGKVLEKGNKESVFRNPLHPYTKMLLNSSLGGIPKIQIEPIGNEKDRGCVYKDHCSERTGRCMDEPPVLFGDGDHRVACIKY